MTSSATIEIPVPAWVSERDGAEIAGDENRMRYMVSLARRNVDEQGGGPFAAGVFDLDTGRLTAAGVNVVVLSCCSVAHAEIVALARAQAAVAAPRLDQCGRYALYTTAQPCSMCYGALFWAGISHLVFGAGRQDIHAITGFDEGPLPRSWKRELSRRGISMQEGILRSECRDVLRLFSERHAPLY